MKGIRILYKEKNIIYNYSSESGFMKSRLSKEKKIKRFFDRNKKKLFYTFLFCFIIIGLFCLYEFLLIPQISLKGSNNTILEYPNKYVEKGYKAKFLGKDISKEVKVSGKVNNKKIGTYKINYKVGKGILKNKTTRTVIVKDTKKPVLGIDKKDVYICPGDEFVPDKITATDNYDGDLSNKIKTVISKEKDMVTYSVTDSSNNTKKISKKIFYKDIEGPIVTLNGEGTSYAYINEGYNDLGVTASDNCDKDVQNKVKVTGEVNINQLGEYKLVYEVVDASDNKSTVERTVVVRERKGIIYLTFDDGPNSGTTNVILDILKEEGVKATFFVTNKGPDELIKREYDEGHTVALHTASHDYSRIYASDDAYFQDLYSVQERVKRLTGYESKIIRFPGGSSNTISRRYNSGIMSRLTQEVLNRGFKYYDWNISSGDAGNTTDPNVVYANVVNNLRQNRENMVLMHDIKPYTRDALRNIIRYGKEHGYVFEKITMDTEMVTQRVNN